jgi:hypothetical protein
MLLNRGEVDRFQSRDLLTEIGKMLTPLRPRRRLRPVPLARFPVQGPRLQSLRRADPRADATPVRQGVFGHALAQAVEFLLDDVTLLFQLAEFDIAIFERTARLDELRSTSRR